MGPTRNNHQRDAAEEAQVEDIVDIVVKVGGAVVEVMDMMGMDLIIGVMADGVEVEVVAVEVVVGAGIGMSMFHDYAKSAQQRAQLGVITVLTAEKLHTKNGIALKKTSPRCNGGDGYTRN